MLGGMRSPEKAVSLPVVERGPILDRNGRVMAVQTRLHSVTAWLPHLSRPEETAQALAEILDVKPQELLSSFTDPESSRFQYIKRKVTPTESDRIETLLRQGKLMGISLEPDFGRSYPQKKLAAPVIGYVGTDNTGLAGIEYTFNRTLAPAVVDQTTKEVYGNRVFLTLDLEAQHITESIAEEAFQRENPEALMAVVMGARSGEILALASLPSFDPNQFQAYPRETWKNHPLVSTYEPGSVFKIFTLASFLDSGAVSPGDTFFCDGSYDREISGAPDIHINCLGTHGNVNAREILMHSCNAGAGYASEQIDPELFYQYLKQLGFGRDTGLPLPGESNGLLRRPEDWSARTRPTLAMGQEIGVSAVQLTAAATVFANSGVLLRPHIVKKVVSPRGKVLKHFDREPVREVFSPATVDRVLSMMEDVTLPDSTASLAQVEGLPMAAKTGTAQRLDPETGTYSEDEYVASCLGLFPAGDPQFVIYIALMNPQGDSYFGGQVAAPLLSRLADRLSLHYGLPRDNIPRENRPKTLTVHKPPSLKPGDTVPDFSGASKRQILPFFSDTRLQLIIRGEGWVVSQDPPPGTPITEGTVIRLELQ